MTRLLIAIVLVMLGTFAHAQPRPDLRPGEAYDLREQTPRDERYPFWCREWDRRDYWRERRACREDFECRRHVDRKARRCGLR
jgi:hypothetical protein